MTASNKSNIFRRMCYKIFLCIVTVTHFFVTFVVALFILSTLNILNQRILHFPKLNFVEVLVTALIFIVSTVVYFRSFKKMALFIRETFFRDPGE